ncbi:phosphodiesterase [Lutimaribacter sp. EGI FJ00015]|uniref:Phosphodiesterase n=1 Tax=Lutimaribacter degradans TaxID=2945989 RepID=A0ACC5ZXL7_9RHOB|nr:phosphodiesterase [Lutimaribacter sp. EGI FJ00013]MCM2562299.1 phosphodiesterase [Lutimaribacter sp. EGI FJ00013]MCO0613454.1 phosphodiesterase [Lutimaribacter sp. EGI FJ00015]MCO0636428.1 phosphodiesterase [Lutimaribacter sp. EGI FJ00014]
MTGPLKLVVMSDLHLVPEGEVSNTLDTAARLRAAVDSVNTHHADADLCILAGDLADLGEADAYRRLQCIVAPLTVATHLMLGNHDDRPTFLKVMGEDHADENGHVQKVIDIKGHRVILLDSSEPGLVEGKMCPARLDWLAARLDEALDRPVIVILHHHVLPLSMPVDSIILRDGPALVDVLRRHPDIRQVIAGHVHITTTGVWKGLPFTTLAGGHYNVSVNLPGHADTQDRLEGPGQYAVILAEDDACVVHFENFLDRHPVIAPENFGRLRAPRR